MKRTVFVLMMSLVFALPTPAQDRGDKKDKGAGKVVVVLGSSVAAGWVTSHEARYDMKNGYAYRLQRLLEPRGYCVINKSVPGDDTADLLDRLDEDLAGSGADFVIIGLSLGNEGIEGDDPEAAFKSFEIGMQKIIEQCRDTGAVPVAGLCYACNTYKQEHYAFTKKMNLKMNQWDVPSVNFLGAADNGHGGFPEGYTYDYGHPDNRGHEEMCYTVVPSLFDALAAGKPAPERIKREGGVTIRGDEREEHISYIPEDIVHSFAMAFSVRTTDQGAVASVCSDGSDRIVQIDKSGAVTYSAGSGRGGSPESSRPAKVDDGKWHHVVISHRYLNGETMVFVDGQKAGIHHERIEPVRFMLGRTSEDAPAPRTAEYRDLMIYRSSLNEDEVRALHDGALLQASLELYAPLRNEKLVKDGPIKNLAQSLTQAWYSPSAPDKALAAVRQKLKAAETARENEFKVTDEKVAIELDPLIVPELFSAYEGRYDLAPGAAFVVRREEDHLVFEGPDGAAARLFPESETEFFMKFPLAELTVTFVRNENSDVSELIFNAGGDEMHMTKAK